MGGELTYTYDGSIGGGGGNFYIIKLIVYRYCDSTIFTAPLDASMLLGIYTGAPTGTAAYVDWYNTESLTLSNSDFVVAPPGNSGCNFTATACIERGEYYTTVLLPDNPDGYHLVVERCCRNGNIMNVVDPGAAGMTFYAYIPPGIINSSPQISDISVPYICTGDTVSIINNAFDPDGDSLVYDFVVPFNGYSGPPNPAPDPFVDNNPYGIPIPEIIYPPGYTAVNFFGPGSYAFIAPGTGLTSYFIPNQGFYVAAIEIREYRNGNLISTIRRDLQFIAITCSPNAMPSFAPTGNGNTFSIGEGQTLCFDVTFTDADGDSLFLTASGPLLDTAMVNPAGTIANASGDNVVTSQFCWTPICGMSRPSPYQFSVSVTDNGCPAKTTNEIFSVFVTNGPASQYPAVSIQQTPPGIICQGSVISFTANPTYPGSSPEYHWFVNGNPTGSNSSIFTSGNLNNGDIITLTMISNATCLLNDTANSPPFIVNVNPQPAPQINITSNPATVLCPQQICLFTANVTNGGAVPSYQWYLNGGTTGTNNYQFTAANPSGVISVYAIVTPSTGCPPQQSNSITFNIVPSFSPEVSLTATLTDSVCPNQQVQFTALASNTGNPPVYSWYLNGILVGDTSGTFSMANFQEGDEITVTATSSYACLSPDFASADPLVYHIYPELQGNLTDGPITICFGEVIDLTMQAVGGNSATWIYDWDFVGLSTPAISFVPQFTGYYAASVDDACFDEVSDSLYVEVLPVPFSDFTWTPGNPSIFTPHVQFEDLSTGAISWYWTLDSTTQTDVQHPRHDYFSGGSYPVTLITENQYGCQDTLIQILEVEPAITAYLPNSFTPNGDGINDEFGLSGFGTGGYSLSVFNRWGASVFSSAGGHEKWKGQNEKGQPSPMGVYVYSVKLVNDPTQKSYIGTVLLVR